MREVIVYTNYKKQEIKFSGQFHCFGTDYEEFESGPGMYPIAIVEKSDGTCESVPINNIKFV